MNKNGFTIIELFIVIMIVSILSSLFLPSFNQNVSATKMLSFVSSISSVKSEIIICFNKNFGNISGCSKSSSYLSSYISSDDINNITVTDGVIEIEFNIKVPLSNENYNLTITPQIVDGRFLYFSESGSYCSNQLIECKT